MAKIHDSTQEITLWIKVDGLPAFICKKPDDLVSLLEKKERGFGTIHRVIWCDDMRTKAYVELKGGSCKEFQDTIQDTFYKRTVRIKCKRPSDSQLKNAISHDDSGPSHSHTAVRERDKSRSWDLRSSAGSPWFRPNNTSKSMTLSSVHTDSSFSNMYTEEDDGDDESITSQLPPLSSWGNFIRDDSLHGKMDYPTDMQSLSTTEGYSTLDSTSTLVPSQPTTSIMPGMEDPGESLPPSNLPSTLLPVTPGTSFQSSVSSRAPSFASHGGSHHRTVKIEGVPEDWDRDILRVAFTNCSQGGGEIAPGGIRREGSIAFIKFKNDQVAEKVTERGQWVVMGQRLAVSLVTEEETLHNRNFNPENTIIIDCIPEDMAYKHLLDSIILTTGLKTTDFSLEQQGSMALVDLHTRFKQGTTAKLVERIQRNPNLKAKVLPEPEGVLLTKVRSDRCKEDFLIKYFSDKPMSGGENVKKVTILSTGEAMVTFKEHKAAKACRRKDHTVILGSDVQVSLYYPVLQPWMAALHACMHGAQKTFSHKELKFPISYDLYKFLQEPIPPGTSGPLDVLNSSVLAGLHATAGAQEIPEYCLMVTPQEGSQYKEHWSDECKEKIHLFLDQFLEVSIPCPYDVYDAVMMIVNDDKSVRHNLSMDVKNIVLVGYREDVSHLKDSIMRYVQKNHRGSESMNLSPDKLAYIHHFLRSELEKCYRVKFTINMKTRTVEVKGIEQNCKEFLLKVENLSPPSKIMSILPVQRGLLTRPSGHDALLKLITAKGCHFFFNQEDNTIHLVAENDQSLRIGEGILENCLSVSDLTAPPSFAKFSRSVEWSSTKEKIESRFTAVVDVSPSADKVYVASLLDQREEVLKVLNTYIQNKCSRTATIPLEPAHWRYLSSSQMWTDIRKQLCNVKHCSLPEEEDPNPQIVLTGDADVVNVLQTKVDKFCTQITKQEAKVSTPGAARYLITYHGRDQLEKVQHTHDALVEWEELPDEVLSVPVEELPGYKQATLVCTCKAPGGVSLYVKTGDLTVYPADVLVSSANGKLTLTGQLSAMFAAQGGSAIQRMCTKYVQRHGHLQPGEAVIFKNTGELPSKAIVHTAAVSPKEGDGNKEEVISRAVQNSLKIAEGYISIAFPALGTGNNKVEGNISSEGMLHGIHSYFKDHPRSSLKEVVIMLHYDRNDLAMDFVGTMQQIFKDVMTPLGVQVLGGSHNRRPSVNKPRRTVQRPTLSSMLKYTSHEVNVEVVRGNLSGDDSTGYIAMEDPGSSLESMHQRSLRPNRVIVRRVEKRKLFFVSQPSTHKECEDTVSLVLEKAEEEGLRSFTIVDELAEKCCHGSERVNTIRHGIDSFLATRVHKNLETIKIYVTMKNTLFSAPTRRSGVKLQVYCLSQKAAEHAMEEMLAAINKACDSVKISEPVISTMSCKMEDMLKREAKERGVSIHVSKSDNSITISGVRDDVKAMKIVVDAEIRKLTARGRVISKVKWQWKNDDCAYQDYSTETSDTIEAAYQSKIAFFFVLTEDGDKCIDFDKMTETGAVSITNVRRHDFKKEGNIPSRWDHCDEPIKCFPLDKDSKEFVDVACQFASTVPSTEGGGVKFGRIKQIERVQNLRCWKRFQTELQRKRHDVADDQQIQQRLFCGCSGEKVDSVNGGEFTKTNQGWGTGAYFSKDASYVCTQVFAPKDGEGVRHIYLCSVVTGDYTQGARKFREPPLKDGNGSDHYDTVVNDINKPTVFVIFRDSLAYPEYHIEFSQSDGGKYIDFDKMMKSGALSITNVRQHDFEKKVILRELCWFPFGIQNVEVGPEGGQFFLGAHQPVDSRRSIDSYTYVEVPAGAVEEGKTVYIACGITPNGPFSFPYGYKLCSMVVYLSVQGAKLKKPMILHIPHWVSVASTQTTKPAKEALLRCCWAPHTLEEGHKTFEFSCLEEESYNMTSRAGEILINGDNCLFADVILMGTSIDFQYEYHVLREIAPRSDVVEKCVRIVITFSSFDWQKIVMDYYKPKLRGNWQADEDMSPEFTFEGDTLEAAISEERGSGWAIALNRQQVAKNNVDYVLSQATTAIELQERVEHFRYPPAVVCRILQSTPPHRMHSKIPRFSYLQMTKVRPMEHLKVPLPVVEWQRVDSRESSMMENVITSAGDLTAYYDKMTPHLTLLGTVLGIENHAAAVMGGAGSPQEKCINILRYWIDTTSEPTWQLFCDRLKRNTQFNGLSGQIEREHLS